MRGEGDCGGGEMYILPYSHLWAYFSSVLSLSSTFLCSVLFSFCLSFQFSCFSSEHSLLPFNYNKTTLVATPKIKKFL